MASLLSYQDEFDSTITKTTDENGAGRNEPSVLEYFVRTEQEVAEEYSPTDIKIMEHDRSGRCESWSDDARKLMEEEKLRVRNEKKDERRIACQKILICGFSSLDPLGRIGPRRKHDEWIMEGTYTEHEFEKNTTEYKITNITLPLQLPEGMLQLRTVVIKNEGRSVTSYIASSQLPGRLHVITNAQHPLINAYFIEHLDILNVIMVNDEIFCSAFKCYYIWDARDNLSGSDKVVSFRRISSKLVEVRLPTDYRFVMAEYCEDYLAYIIVEHVSGARKVAQIYKNRSTSSTWITIELLIYPSYWDKVGEHIFGHRITNHGNRITEWRNNKLFLFDANSEIYIEDVEQDESIQMLTLLHRLDLIIIMKEIEGQTSIRIYDILLQNRKYSFRKRDQMIISNSPAAITPLVDAQTTALQICHLRRSLIECFTNLEDPIYLITEK